MMLRDYARRRWLPKREKTGLSSISCRRNRKSLKSAVLHLRLIKNQKSENRKIPHRIGHRIIMSMG